MTITIVYNSKTGFTKQYALWIAGELGCNTMPYSAFSKKAATENDIIVFGSFVHAGKIDKLDKIKTAMSDKPGTKLIVFATGATPGEVTEVVDQIWSDHLTDAEQHSIPHFYMQSGLKYENMGFVDRTMMKFVAKLMSKKENKTENEAGFAAAIEHSYDASSKEYIVPLVDYIKRHYS